MDPISIAAGTLGFAFLQEGVKFLWSEAGKILDRYHKRSELADAATVSDPAPAGFDLPTQRTIRFDVVERREQEIRTLLKELALYANGIEPIAPSDDKLLELADSLQRVVVEAYGLDAPMLRVKATVTTEDVGTDGKVVGADLEGVNDVDVETNVRTKKVDGSVTGARIVNR